MPFKRGDHVCGLYSAQAELVREVAAFLAEGLRRRERCWYVGTAKEMGAVATALRRLGFDVSAETGRDALKLISGAGAYVVHGRFNPETTINIFNNAIEQANTDGFSGFRAAAEMSWALDCEDGVNRVLVYEALLKSLFANCRAIGLCLYHRKRMPLAILDGALSTHPVAGARGHYGSNPFYDPAIIGAAGIDPAVTRKKLAMVDRSRFIAT